MPAVSKQFTTYHDFASASLDEIYGDRLKNAYKVTANHLESGVWINESANQGKISLKWNSLPWDAQISPINDIVFGDFNGDGKMELILAQNHLSNWIETGLWRGNPGCHLEWNGKKFTTIPHLNSGVMMPGDTKAILSIDADGDGKLDLLAAPNNESLMLFLNN